LTEYLDLVDYLLIAEAVLGVSAETAGNSITIWECRQPDPRCPSPNGTQHPPRV